LQHVETTQNQELEEELDIVVDYFMHSLGSYGLTNRYQGARGNFHTLFICNGVETTQNQELEEELDIVVDYFMHSLGS
jgi:bacterioferritin (cytochrome b1)